MVAQTPAQGKPAGVPSTKGAPQELDARQRDETDSPPRQGRKEHREAHPTPKPREESIIAKEDAVDMARKAIEGHVDYDRSLKVQVQLQGGVYCVTFPVQLPEGALGPDYAARVYIDARTGKVQRILRAS